MTDAEAYATIESAYVAARGLLTEKEGLLKMLTGAQRVLTALEGPETHTPSGPAMTPEAEVLPFSSHPAPTCSPSSW